MIVIYRNADKILEVVKKFVVIMDIIAPFAVSVVVCKGLTASFAVFYLFTLNRLQYSLFPRTLWDTIRCSALFSSKKIPSKKIPTHILTLINGDEIEVVLEILVSMLGFEKLWNTNTDALRVNRWQFKTPYTQNLSQQKGSECSWLFYLISVIMDFESWFNYRYKVCKNLTKSESFIIAMKICFL